MTGWKIGLASSPCFDFVDYADHKCDGKMNKRIQRIYTKKMRNWIKKQTVKELRLEN